MAVPSAPRSPKTVMRTASSGTAGFAASGSIPSLVGVSGSCAARGKTHAASEAAGARWAVASARVEDGR